MKGKILDFNIQESKGVILLDKETYINNKKCWF